MDADRLVFEVVPSVLGLFLAGYSVARMRRMREDFFTVVRGWVFALFLSSMVMIWAFEASKDLLGSWPEQSHAAVTSTFIVVTIWLSVCIVALNTRHRTLSTFEHFSGWIGKHPFNIMTGWGVVGLAVIVYSWAVNPPAEGIADEPLMLGLVLGYLAASVAADLLLSLSGKGEGFAPPARLEMFGGMAGVGLAWIGIPASAFAFGMVLGGVVDYEGPDPYMWVTVALFAAILGRVTEARFTALIVDPEVENTRRSGFRAYDIPRGPYIIEDERPEAATRLFSELISLPLRPDAAVPVKDDSPSATLEYLIPNGLMVTREYPENIRKAYGIQTTPIIWLTEMPGERRVSPTSLAVLTDTIIRFMDSNPNSIVLLDGVEYLVTFNEFKKVLRHLDSLNETTWVTKARLLVAINPKAYDEKELAMLERDRRVVKGEAGVEELKKASKVVSGPVGRGP